MFTTTRFNYRNFRLAAICVSAIAAAVFFFSFYLGKNELFLLLNTDLSSIGDFLFNYGTYAGDGMLWLVWLAAILYTKRRHLFPIIISSFLLSTLFTQVGKQLILPNTARPAEAIKLVALGVEPNDGIKAINGKPVTTYNEMYSIINGVPIGQKITTTAVRGDKEIAITMNIDKDVSVHVVPGVDVHSYGSFPSGHTATAFTFALLIALLIRSAGISIVCVLVAVFVGYTRVYLSQHFPLDVAAGMIVAVLSVALSIRIQKYFDKRRWEKHQRVLVD